MGGAGKGPASDSASHAVVIDPTSVQSQRWYRGVPRYAWVVLFISALGWLFDTMDQNIFTLVRQPAVASLLYPGVAMATLSKAQQAAITSAGGTMTAIFLLGWAAGGLAFGCLATDWAVRGP